MAILPEGSLLTFTDGFTPVSVAVESIRYKEIRDPFTRSEFTGDRQRQAKNIDGSTAVIVPGIGNQPEQYFTNCNVNEEPRPTDPDDSRIDDIFKRFDTIRYEITGALSLASQVDQIYTWSKDHSVFLSRFAAHFEIAKGDVSIIYLTGTAQAETFSYITTTNIIMSGRALGTYSPVTNCLITEFTPDVTSEIPGDEANTFSTVYKSWSIVVEKRTLVSARSLVY